MLITDAVLIIAVLSSVHKVHYTVYRMQAMQAAKARHDFKSEQWSKRGNQLLSLSFSERHLKLRLNAATEA